MAVRSAPVLIGVDWGTSSFRAFLIDGEGSILDTRASGEGILNVPEGGFGATLDAQIGAWLRQRRLPVLMSGMIGSRQGWLEAPYRQAPCDLADLAGTLIAVPDGPSEIRIVPGVATAGGGAMPDVMRGEEVQVFGAGTASSGSTSFLLPGTHSKWVRVEEGRIVGFRTYMTGELFAACRRHTILGRLMAEGGSAPESFDRGVRDGAAEGQPGALLHRLFGVRTAGLFGKIPAEGLEEYLSGLLIGAELADAAPPRGAPVRLVASSALAPRYEAAARLLGIAVEPVPPESVVGAYLAIARTAGLIGAAA